MLLCLCTASHAQGEHTRRAAAELQVMLGDARKLAALKNAEVEPLLQKGLGDRIAGGLAPLDILLRLADRETQRESDNHAAVVQTMRMQLANGNLAGLIEALVALVQRYPLAIPHHRATDASRETARTIHRQHCAACHDNPATGIERPAYQLQQQAQQLSASEFLARMLVGVRGDRLSGIDNPLTDAQIMALIAWYRSGD